MVNSRKEISARDIVIGSKRPVAIKVLAEKYGLKADDFEGAVDELQKEGYG